MARLAEALASACGGAAGRHPGLAQLHAQILILIRAQAPTLGGATAQHTSAHLLADGRGTAASHEGATGACHSAGAAICASPPPLALHNSSRAAARPWRGSCTHGSGRAHLGSSARGCGNDCAAASAWLAPLAAAGFCSSSVCTSAAKPHYEHQAHGRHGARQRGSQADGGGSSAGSGSGSGGRGGTRTAPPPPHGEGGATLPVCHYDVLAVKRQATLAEIKQAFRQRAKELHPDRIRGASPGPAPPRPAPRAHAAANSDATAAAAASHASDGCAADAASAAASAADDFIRIAAAYEVLSSAEARRAYDLDLARLEAEAEAGGAGPSSASPAAPPTTPTRARSPSAAPGARPPSDLADVDFRAWRYGVGDWMARPRREPVVDGSGSGARGAALEYYLRKYASEFESELHAALVHAYLGPRLALEPGQLPRCFEAEARRVPSSSPDLLHLVSGRTLLGVVRLMQERPALPGPGGGGAAPELAAGQPRVERLHDQQQQRGRLGAHERSVDGGAEAASAGEGSHHRAAHQPASPALAGAGDANHLGGCAREAAGPGDAAPGPPAAVASSGGANPEEDLMAVQQQQQQQAVPHMAATHEPAAAARGPAPSPAPRPPIRPPAASPAAPPATGHATKAPAGPPAAAPATAPASTPASPGPAPGPARTSAPLAPSRLGQVQPQQEEADLLRQAAAAIAEDVSAGGAAQLPLVPLYSRLRGLLDVQGFYPDPAQMQRRSLQVSLVTAAEAVQARDPGRGIGGARLQAQWSAAAQRQRASGGAEGGGGCAGEVVPDGVMPPAPVLALQQVNEEAERQLQADDGVKQQQRRQGQVEYAFEPSPENIPSLWDFGPETADPRVTTLQLFFGQELAAVAVHQVDGPAHGGRGKAAEDNVAGQGPLTEGGADGGGSGGDGGGGSSGSLVVPLFGPVVEGRLKVYVRGRLELCVSGRHVYDTQGRRVALVVRGAFPGVRTIHFFDATTRRLRLLCRCVRARLLPSPTWLFPPREGTHDVGGWYFEWGGYERRGRPGWLDPSAYVLLAAVISREQERVGQARAALVRSTLRGWADALHGLVRGKG